MRSEIIIGGTVLQGVMKGSGTDTTTNPIVRHMPVHSWLAVAMRYI